MKIWQSLRTGLRTVFGTPKVAVGIYLVNLSLALLLAFPLYQVLRGSFAYSTVRETMLLGFDYDWWTEFSAHAEGLAKTFRPEVIGIGPFFENAQVFLQGAFGRHGVLVLLVGLLYLVANSFLAGAAMGAYAQERQKLSTARVFATGGQFFGRFLSLVLMGVAIYFVVYKGAGSLVQKLGASISEGLTTERAAFFVGALGVALLLFILSFVNMIFDYAKAVVVHENRQSSAEALWVATKFGLTNIGKCLGLYWLIGSAGVTILLFTFWIVSAVPQNVGWGIVLSALLAQVLVILKIMIRLVFYASQLVAYRTAKAEVRRLPKA